MCHLKGSSDKWVITAMRKGKGERQNILFLEIYDPTENLTFSGSIDYVFRKLKKQLMKEHLKEI